MKAFREQNHRQFRVLSIVYGKYLKAEVRWKAWCGYRVFFQNLVKSRRQSDGLIRKAHSIFFHTRKKPVLHQSREEVFQSKNDVPISGIQEFEMQMDIPWLIRHLNCFFWRNIKYGAITGSH